MLSSADKSERECRTSLRVMIVAHDFPPLNTSASRRPYSWARTWSDMGHEVHVLTTAKYAHDSVAAGGPPIGGFRIHAVPYLPGVRPVESPGDASPAAGRARRNRLLDAVRVATRRLRLGLGLFTEKTTLAYFPMRRAGLRLLAMQRFDLIVSTSGPDVCPLIAAALSRRGGVFWLSDYRDLWFDEFAVGRYAATTWFVNRLQSRLVRRADLVSTVSRGLAGYLEPLAPGRVHVCYNGYLESAAAASVKRTDDARVRIVYTGTFYPRKRDPVLFFDALAALRAAHPDLRDRFRVDCFGPVEEWVVRQVSQRGLASVMNFAGSVSYAESLAAQRGADVLLFVDWMDARAEGVLTGKLFEYLAAGRPILCIGSREDTEAVQVIHDCGAGRVAVTQEQALLALVDLASCSSRTSSETGLAAKFSRKAQALALLERVREVMATSGHAPTL